MFPIPNPCMKQKIHESLKLRNGEGNDRYPGRYLGSTKRIGVSKKYTWTCREINSVAILGASRELVTAFA